MEKQKRTVTGDWDGEEITRPMTGEEIREDRLKTEQLELYFNQFLVELTRFAIIEIDDKTHQARLDLTQFHNIYADLKKYVSDMLTVDNSQKSEK